LEIIQQASRLLHLLILSILGLCIGQGCTSHQGLTLAQSPASSVVIDAGFSTQRINKQVRVCTKLTEKDLYSKRKGLRIGQTEIES